MQQATYTTLLLLAIGSMLGAIYCLLRTLAGIKPDKQVVAALLGAFSLAANGIFTDEGNKYKIRFLIFLLITMVLMGLVLVADNAIKGIV